MYMYHAIYKHCLYLFHFIFDTLTKESCEISYSEMVCTKFVHRENPQIIRGFSQCTYTLRIWRIVLINIIFVRNFCWYMDVTSL